MPSTQNEPCPLRLWTQDCGLWTSALRPLASGLWLLSRRSLGEDGSAFPEEMPAYSKRLKGVGDALRHLASARVVPGRAKSWMGALNLRLRTPFRALSRRSPGEDGSAFKQFKPNQGHSTPKNFFRGRRPTRLAGIRLRQGFDGQGGSPHHLSFGIRVHSCPSVVENRRRSQTAATFVVRLGERRPGAYDSAHATSFESSEFHQTGRGCRRGSQLGVLSQPIGARPIGPFRQCSGCQ